MVYALVSYASPFFIQEHYVGNLKVATDLDKRRAVKYALEKMCKDNGYRWVEGGDEFTYDCKHTKETCLQESVYPTPDSDDAVPQYYEWRDASDPEAKETGEGTVQYGTGRQLSASVGQSSDYSLAEDVTKGGGVCIIGLEDFRKFCEKEDLRYDPRTGKCYATEPYCLSKQLAFCDGDCFEPPVAKVASFILGDTVGRSIGAAVGENRSLNAICQAASKT